MPAYVVGTTEITDRSAIGPYLEGVSAVVEGYGGRFLAAGPVDAVLEGGVDCAAMGAVIMFDSVEDAKDWYASPQYEALRVHRHRAGRSTVIVFDGLDA